MKVTSGGYISTIEVSDGEMSRFDLISTLATGPRSEEEGLHGLPLLLDVIGELDSHDIHRADSDRRHKIRTSRSGQP